MANVDTDRWERFEVESPQEAKRINADMRKIYGGSWDEWWLKTVRDGVVWCNCPHFHGLDGLKVEDLTFVEIEGGGASARRWRTRAPTFPASRTRTCWTPAPRSASGRRGCCRASTCSRRRTSSAGGGSTTASAAGATTTCRTARSSRWVSRTCWSRTPLLGDAGGPAGEPRDPAVPGHGAGRRHRRGPRAPGEDQPGTCPCDGFRRSLVSQGAILETKSDPAGDFLAAGAAAAGAVVSTSQSTRSCRSTREPRSSIDRRGPWTTEAGMPRGRLSESRCPDRGVLRRLRPALRGSAATADLSPHVRRSQEGEAMTTARQAISRRTFLKGAPAGAAIAASAAGARRPPRP